MLAPSGYEAEVTADDLVITVPGLPPLLAGGPVVSDSRAVVAFQRLHERVSSVVENRGCFPIHIGNVGIELTVVSPSPQDFGDAGRCLNAVIWGLVSSSEEVLNQGSGTWLVREPNQIVQMRFRWEEGTEANYRVRLWLVAPAD